MNKNLISSVFILLPFLFVSLATSPSKDYKGDPINYTLQSDCSNASLTSGIVTIQWVYASRSDVIISPPDKTYLDIGLPYAQLDLGYDDILTADIAPALTRSCQYSRVRANEVISHVYACSDNSIPSCTVTLTRAQ